MAGAGPLVVGDLLAGRYLLLDVVADDGPAVLWRATDEILARAVAVKVLPTPNKRARDAAEPFLDAAVRTCAINHPGLARVYDATLEHRPGRGNDVAFVISEWVDGESLDEHLTQTGALAPLDAVDVLRQAADALIAAHAGRTAARAPAPAQRAGHPVGSGADHRRRRRLGAARAAGRGGARRRPASAATPATWPPSSTPSSPPAGRG